MDYRFTIILFIMITLLALFGGPAHSRNEYLNEYGSRCGDFETRVEAEDRNGKYNHYNDNNNYRNDDDNYRLSFTYRKYLDKFMVWQLHNRTEIVIAVVAFVIGAILF